MPSWPEVLVIGGDRERSLAVPAERFGQLLTVAFCADNLTMEFLDGGLHVLVFKETMTGIRVRSFRRVNARERHFHGQAQTIDG